MMTVNMHETHHILIQMKHALLFPLSLLHMNGHKSVQRKPIKPTKQMKQQQNSLRSLLTAMGRGPEKIQHLSHDNHLTSSSWRDEQLSHL